MSKTNILAETLAEIQELREAVEKNANIALTSTLKGELEDIVKKNLDESWTNEELTDDMPGDGLPGDQDPMGDNSVEGDFADDQANLPGGNEDGDEEVIDLTDQPDEEVIKHFNLMNPADEIEIVQKADGGIQIDIKPSEETPAEDETAPEETPAGDETMSAEPGSDDEELKIAEGGLQEETTNLEEEPVYEVEISEEDVKDLEETIEETQDVAEETNESAVEEDVDHNTAKAHMKNKEQELHESLVVMRKKYQEIVAENNKKTKELDGLKGLVEEFKGSETEYKDAIKNLKSQLQEVALFSSNLTYAIKLITENSTTKDEKLEILKRFDNAKNLNESREIFNTMQSQFSSNKAATKQMVEEKIMESPKSSGSSKLNESTAYQNPQLSRILEIIGKI